MTAVECWLLALADPEKPAGVLPSDRLGAPDVPLLCVLAEQHGVLPAALRRVEELLRTKPERLLADARLGAEALAAIDPMRRRLAQRSAMAMFLGAEAHKLTGELASAGAEAIVLKGADFAARLYSQRGRRGFAHSRRRLGTGGGDDGAAGLRPARVSDEVCGGLRGTFVGKSGNAWGDGRGA